MCQGAVAAGNVSETIYMAESLYLRFDITTHVFFTVRASWATGLAHGSAAAHGRAVRRF
jgi:hypothetical protein